MRGPRKKPGLCGDRCAGCRYSGWMDMGDDGRMLRGCVYILRRGTRRPCPAGEGCTAYEPKVYHRAVIFFGGEGKARAGG